MELAKMIALKFWRNAPKRLPAVQLEPVVPVADKAAGKHGRLSRARVADTDGRARRRNQLVEDNRLL